MDDSGYPEMVRALLQPEAYPGQDVTAVELVETHVSYLFLTGRLVYKVKKAVDYGFLDFTTLERRRHFCRQEVELNRRMAPEVYLGVSEVRRSRGRYRMDGPGETVEYAVRMRQLPRERAMDQLLRRGQVSSQDIRRLAAKIARFHAGAAAGPEITRLGGLDTVRRNIEDNFAQIRRFVGLCLTQEAIQALEDYSRDFMAERREVFQRRAAEGRIRDCHGDLHTAQIFLLEPGRAAAADGSDGISIIDCIEFNDRFRYCDVAEDIAFLAMDLDYHGRPDLSAQFVREYVAVTEDPGVLELLDFFKVYRACIRGKVTAFRLEMPAGAPEVQPEKRSISPEQGRLLAAAQGYFALALGYVRQAAPPPSGQLLPPDRP